MKTRYVLNEPQASKAALPTSRPYSSQRFVTHRLRCKNPRGMIVKEKDRMERDIEGEGKRRREKEKRKERRRGRRREKGRKRGREGEGEGEGESKCF